MILKNAEIKTVREAVERLMHGEVFFYKSFALYFDEYRGFIFDNIIKGRQLDYKPSNMWLYIDEWKVEDQWYNNIPKVGRLCLVWDNINPEDKIHIVIVKYNEEFGTFEDVLGFTWDNARPLTNKEIKEFLSDDDN